MFQSLMTIIRELHLYMAKVILTTLGKITSFYIYIYIYIYGDVVACRRAACVLCAVHTAHHTMNERADQLHHDNAPAHSTARAGFLAKHHITQVCQPPYSPHLAPCDFWLFPKLKSPLKGRRCVNATVTQYTGSVNGVSLPTD